MRILVLGGTQFVGRHIVEAALGRGHELTIFNRGRTRRGLFPGVQRLTGDRDGDLGALEAGSWDAVVDTSGYVPRVVRRSAELLEPHVGRYLFVSSISVYADFSQPGIDERAPLAQLEKPTEEHKGPAYGPLKALSEQVVQEVYDERAAIVRPGLIVGPWDPTGRFTYWPVRIAADGTVLAPGPPDAPVQVIDARDLAAFCIHLLEEEAGGVFNVTGPEAPLTMHGLLQQCRDVAQSDAQVRWAPGGWLVEQGVQPWMELPLWLGPDEAWSAHHQIDATRAIAAGLRFRPLAETIADTLAWVQSGEAPIDPPAGMARERESELLGEL